MPDRHSRPARPRDTAVPTTTSQDSPAATSTLVASPSARKSTPASATCRTSPSNPPSATTRLLPPPSTNSGMPLSPAQLNAATTSWIVAARANHLAFPPTPSVVIGASCTFSCGTIVRSANGRDLSFRRDEGRNRVRPSADFELDPVARPELPRQRQVRGNDDRELRVSTGRLPVRHQEDGIARRWNLQAAHERHV